MYPPDGQTAPPEADPLNWFGQMLGQMGFPAPQFVTQELQRLNNNMEAIAELLNPEDMRELTAALREASDTGRSLLNKLK